MQGNLIEDSWRSLPALWIRVVALRVNDAREHLFELDRHQHAGLGIAFNVDQLDVSMTCRGDRLMLGARKRNQSVGFIDIVSGIIDVIKCFLCKGCCCLQEKREKNCGQLAWKGQSMFSNGDILSVVSTCEML